MSYVEVMALFGDGIGTVTQYAWSRDKNEHKAVLSDVKYFIFGTLKVS
jgi:hypothetical protein